LTLSSESGKAAAELLEEILAELVVSAEQLREQHAVAA
jgi:hypothetical protein